MIFQRRKPYGISPIYTVRDKFETAFLVLQTQQNITVCTWPYEFEIATATSGRTAKKVKDQY